MPFRIFDRKNLYVDLKFKMMNNLLLASKVAERDGTAIINRYNSIDSYFDNEIRQIDKIYRKRDLKLGLDAPS